MWNESTEVLAGTLDDLLRAIQGVLTREPRGRARSRAAGPLYLLCTKADLEQDDGNLVKLRDSLFRAGVLPEFPAFDEQDVNLAELERTLIAQSCGTIIYYGRGGDGWVKLKRQTAPAGPRRAQGAGATRPGNLPRAPRPTRRSRRSTRAWVRAFTEARGFPPLLVLGNTGSFEPDQLKPLLERIVAGGPAS